MQSPRHLQALLCACILLSVAALASLAIGSAASEQMAAKRRISLQLRQEMEHCAHLEAAQAQFCRCQCQDHAEVAMAELRAHRQARRRAHMHRVAAHYRIDASRCSALPRRLRERCVDALPTPQSS